MNQRGAVAETALAIVVMTALALFMLFSQEGCLLKSKELEINIPTDYSTHTEGVYADEKK